MTLPPWYISDIDGVDLRPDPDTITTVAQLQYAMRQYRVWAGNPSFHTLSQRCRNRVSASSLCQALTSDDLPPLKVVRDFIGACGATREYRDRFERTWRRLSLST